MIEFPPYLTDPDPQVLYREIVKGFTLEVASARDGDSYVLMGEISQGGMMLRLYAVADVEQIHNPAGVPLRKMSREMCLAAAWNLLEDMKTQVILDPQDFQVMVIVNQHGRDNPARVEQAQWN